MLRPCYCLVALVFTTVASSYSKDLIHLKSGYTVVADSYLQRGDVCVVQRGAGSMEFSASDIGFIEALADQPVAANPPNPVRSPAPEDLVNQAALAEGLDEAFVRSVAKIESDFRPGAKSIKGAIGVMQLMPATAFALGVDAGHEDENARGGAKYLRSLLLQYGGNSALALAAYNAGPGTVKRYGGVPPFSETQKYVKKVTQEYDKQLRLRSEKLHKESRHRADTPPVG